MAAGDQEDLADRRRRSHQLVEELLDVQAVQEDDFDDRLVAAGRAELDERGAAG